MLFGLAPWIAFWALVGNAPFVAAALVALAIAVATLAGGRGRLLAIGSVAVFAALTVLTVLAPDAYLQRWMLPLGNTGILAVALVSVLIGTPFVRDFAAAEQPAAVVSSELFDPMVARLSWIWIAAFAGMTLSSALPAVLDREATLHDTTTPLCYLCYGVIPVILLAGAAIAARILPDRMTDGFADAVRKTSFVAFVDLEIDQLYYLATEHANREVGPGQEAYNVTVGTRGTPLVGDETRVSWPSTFKVRQRKS